MVVSVAGCFYAFDHGDAGFVIGDMGDTSERNIVLGHICEIGIFF